MHKSRLLLRILFLIILLYIFIVSIGLIGASFKLLGEDAAKDMLATVANPLAGLFIGILATSLVQSSSTTTSIVVGLVGSGLVPVDIAIPIVMGANVGTSVTNTIVSAGHISRSHEFKRAFATATVHDFFNLCSVAILFPLEMTTHFIRKLANYGASLFAGSGGIEFKSPLKMITKPIVEEITHLAGDSSIIVIVIGLVLLFIALKYLVSTLRGLVLKRTDTVFSSLIFNSTPRALLLGLILTTLVQSSSITTSLVVPLVGAGLLTITQVYPYTLGANIGTTVTAFLAALATGSAAAVAVAFAHLIFNISGTTIFLTYPLRRIPVFLATNLAEFSIRSKAYPFFYIAIVFFAIPLLLIFIAER